MVVQLKEIDRDLLGHPSPAEYDVLRMISEGLTNKEIACKRGSHIRTIKKQVHLLFLKLRVVGRDELVQVAKEKGLL